MGYKYIERLEYGLKPEEGFFAVDAHPVEWHTDGFSMRLDDGVLTVWVKVYYTNSQVYEQVQKHLRRWEILANLRYRRPRVHFEFVKAYHGYLEHHPPGAPQQTETVGSSREMLWHVESPKHQYPQPPEEFEVSGDVELLWSLYNRYLCGKDRLLPMAYTCLTRLEYSAGSRPAAAEHYNVSPKVFTELSKLSSNRGTGLEARKFEKPGNQRDPTPQEVKWIEHVVSALIQRAGEVAYDSNRTWPKITRSGFPKLS